MLGFRRTSEELYVMELHDPLLASLLLSVLAYATADANADAKGHAKATHVPEVGGVGGLGGDQTWAYDMFQNIKVDRLLDEAIIQRT